MAISDRGQLVCITLYRIFRFVSPALYVSERKYVIRVAKDGYVMYNLVVTAVITSTSYVFTLPLVALPMWVLYEMGII